MKYASIFTTFLLTFTSLPTRAAAAVDTSLCQAQGTFHIQRPYYPGQTNSPTFDYSYFYKAPDAGKLTVIFLTGGPGESAMDQQDLKSMTAELPAGFGLMLIDYRGLGCNKPPAGKLFPAAFYNSVYFSLDVIAAINQSHVTNYAVYGASYGTMTATEVAGLAEQGLAPKPTAEVLEGVIGHADQQQGDLYSEYMNQWDLVKATLPPEIVAELSGPTPALGLTAEDWGNWIQDQLTFSSGLVDKTAPAGITDPQFSMLSVLMPGSDPAAQAKLALAIKNDSHADHKIDKATQYLYQQIDCHEDTFTPTNSNMDADFKLVNGELIAEHSKICAGIPMDRPFDAAKFKTSAPVYYFQGARDPSTPIYQAFYHFYSQTTATRTLVEIPDAGHCAFDDSAMKACAPTMWGVIANGGTGLEAALQTCPLATTVLTLKPGESELDAPAVTITQQ